MREYSGIFDGDTCRLCGQVRHVKDAHAEIHLSRGEALVVVDYTRTGRTESVIPMPSQNPAESGVRPFQVLTSPKKPDQKLLAIARAALARTRKPS